PVTEGASRQSRGVTVAVCCEGAYEVSSRYHAFMDWPMPWYSVPEGSVERLIAGRHFGILASYLRHGDRVFETYFTTGRGNEIMAQSYGLLDRTVYWRKSRRADSLAGCTQTWY